MSSKFVEISFKHSQRIWRKLVDVKFYKEKICKICVNYFKICNENIINHFGGRNELPSIRLYRLTSFLFAFITCLCFTISYYVTWKNNPVMVAYDNEFTDTSEIPFPAVTMCYNPKVDLDKFDVTNVSKFIDLDKKTILEPGSEFYLETLSHLCSFGYRRCNVKSSRKPRRCYRSSPCALQLHDFKLNMTGADYVKSLEEISVLDFINELKFENDDDFFYEKPIYRRLVTEEGICYTINLDENKNMFTAEIADYLIKFDDLDTHFNDLTKPDKYPVHASKSGREYGLTILTEDLADNFNGMCAIKDGFKITLHSPLTHPRMSTHFIDVPADDVTMIAIKPFVITTSEDLRQYDPKIRHCYFENEKKLQFFRHYSQSNCEYECYIQRLMTTCGCVAFYMPHVNGSRICQSSAEKSCHCDFRENYGQLKDCDCLPSCNSVAYDTEITSSKREPTPENIEHVSVYFKKDYFLRIKRFQVFGWASFWSSIGGFLGLLMGGSVLSIFEVFYNIFIRHCFTKRNEILKAEPSKSKNEIIEAKKGIKRMRSSQSCRF